MSYKDLFTPEFWQQLLSNDFNRGYIAGVTLVVGVMILLLVLKIIWKIMFRTRRCSTVEVRCEGGNLIISRDAVENAARQVLEAFPQLDVNRIGLFRKGANYRLALFCTYSADGKGLPELAGQVKPEMTDTMRRVFGIETIDQIKLHIEKLDSRIDTKMADHSDAAADSGL